MIKAFCQTRMLRTKSADDIGKDLPTRSAPVNI
jgi:hypothetical protein